MDTGISAPLLSRVKSWQLVGLGLSGWFTLYSIAIITWGASSALMGNAQGGCFAATMTLASFETRRHRQGVSAPPGSLEWAGTIPTEHLNQTLAQAMRQQGFQIEAGHATGVAMGFGVRVVNAGRTLVFETGRWQEPVIDLRHAAATEENRKKVYADLAIIVSAGKPDEAARTFVRTRPLKFLVGKELKNLFHGENPPANNV